MEKFIPIKYTISILINANKIRQVITLKSSSNSRIEGNDLIGMESNRSPEIGHRDISEA